MNERFRFDLECAERHALPPVVGGADEAGRGALAGPLVAAAVCFDYRRFAEDDYGALAAVHDSKRLAPADREHLYTDILARASAVACVAYAAPRIDERGLHVCNLWALRRALEGLAPRPALLFVDGMRPAEGVPDCEVLVGGDGRSAAAAAASIVAKVTRDRVMTRMHDVYPQWGFCGHVGYATSAHHDAIASYGVCALHRLSFRSVAYRQLDLGL